MPSPRQRRLDIPPDAFMGWLNADDSLWKGCITEVQRICRDLPRAEWLGGIPLLRGYRQKRFSTA
jgi:hypothetical protein